MMLIAIFAFWVIAVLYVAGRLGASLVKSRLVLSKRPALAWFDGFVFWLCASFVIYGWGWGLTVEKDPGDRCVGRRHGVGEVESANGDLFPLSARCIYSDGTVIEVIPPWVNPVIVISIAFSAACLLSSGVAIARSHRSS